VRVVTTVVCGAELCLRWRGLMRAVDLPAASGVFEGIMAPPGFSDLGDGAGGPATGDGDVDGDPSRPKRVREVCFNCWSRGMGAKCELHLPPGEKDRPVPPGKSALVCNNWDLAAISRKYRSEEIQEVCVVLGRPALSSAGLVTTCGCGVAFRCLQRPARHCDTTRTDASL
jgi:hypothetical protein